MGPAVNLVHLFRLHILQLIMYRIPVYGKGNVGHLKMSGAYLNKESLLAITLKKEKVLVILWLPLGPLV